MNMYANNIVAGGDLKVNTQGAYDEIKKVIESGDFLNEQQDKSLPGQVDIFNMGGKASEKERASQVDGESDTGRSAVQGGKAKKAERPAAKKIESSKVKEEAAVTGVEHFASLKYGPMVGNATGHNVTGKSKRASEIFSDFGNKLDVAIKRKHRGTSLGTFNNQTYIVRIKKANDIPVLSHETGHMLDRMYQLSITINKPVRAELEKLGQVTSSPSYTKSRVRREGIAEFLRLYLTDESVARQQAPETYKYFESKVPRDILKVLHGL
jgi:hypothetical protein